MTELVESPAFSEEEITEAHIAVASNWLRDERWSGRYAKGSFYTDLKSWLYTHRWLTRRQALHVCNLMLGTEQWQRYLDHVRSVKQMAGSSEKPCADGELGKPHDRHAWNIEGVTFVCPGVSERLTKHVEARLKGKVQYCYHTGSGKLHVIERAWYEWEPLPSWTGYYDPNYRVQLPCKIISDLSVAYRAVGYAEAQEFLATGQLEWCRTCLRLAGHKYKLPKKPRRQLSARVCKARGLARYQDAEYDCELIRDHAKQHRDPKTGTLWNDNSVVRLA